MYGQVKNKNNKILSNYNELCPLLNIECIYKLENPVSLTIESENLDDYYIIIGNNKTENFSYKVFKNTVDNNTIFYLNTNIVKKYFIASNNFLIFAIDNELFIFGLSELRSNILQLELVSNEDPVGLAIASENYIYKVKHNYNNIIDIEFNNTFILLKCLDSKTNTIKYYVCADKSNEYEFNWKELVVYDTQLIFHSLINLHNKNNNVYFNKTTYIDINENFLDQLITIVKSNEHKTYFSFIYRNLNINTSYGNGVHREFMTKCMNILKEKYLINGNIFTTFNFTELSKLSENNLFYLGYILAYNLNYNVIKLPFRLPIVFLKLLSHKKSFDDEIINYFAKIEFDFYDKITNSTLNELIDICAVDTCSEVFLHNKNNLINQLFVDYMKININENEQKIIDIMYNGFNLFNIKNLDKMNAPTIDYLISGPFIIDRELLLTQTHYHIMDSNIVVNELFKTMCELYLREIIKNATDDEIKIYLINISGSQFINTCNYNFFIYDKTNSTTSTSLRNVDIKFATCSREIYLSSEILFEDISVLKNMLLTQQNMLMD